MEADDLALFARWMKQRREALDLTQKELADATDCSISTIRKMEMGLRRPSKQVAELLAIRLQIAPEEYSTFMQFARGSASTHRKHTLPPLPPTNAAPQSASAAYHTQVPDNQNRMPASESQPPSWPPTNLPTPLTSFVGREQVLERVRSLLWRTDVRLLTLTGPPGIGKTRLSIETASGLLGDFTDGVFLVSLAPISDPALVLPAIAETVEMPQSSSDLKEARRPILDRLSQYLRSKRMLLVLDNFEQVTEAARDVAHLLTAAGRLKVLATSRVPLHISGEHEVAVPPLDMPHDRAATPASLDELRRFEAIQLFVRRARMAQADFTLSDDNIHAVVEICRQLDGLPLAIELAAARIKMLTPQALLALLSGRLLTLMGGAQDLPERHQTLRNAIEWSYDLLHDGEKQLFHRMAVFQGGCTLRAIAAVCDFDGRLAITVEEGVELLAGKSLLTMREGLQQKEGEAKEQRFGMLETIHEYAWEKLAEADASDTGEGEALKRSHALYFLGLSEEARQQINGNDQKAWLDILEEEYNNIKAAFSFLLEEAQSKEYAVELTLRLSRALGRFWYIRGNTGEGRNWLEAAMKAEDMWAAQIDQSDTSDAEARLSLLGSVVSETGLMAWSQTDYRAAGDYYAQSLSIGRQLGDKLQIARALNNLGMVATEEAKFTEAENFYQEALQIAEELGETVGVIRLLNNLGVIAHKQGDYGNARRYYEGSLELRQNQGDRQGMGFILTNIGSMALYMGDLDTSKDLQEQALTIGRELGDRHTTYRALNGLGDAYIRAGDFAQADSLYREGLQVAQENESKLGVCEALEGMLQIAVARKEPVKAAHLYGVADGIRAAIASPRNAPEQEYLDRTLFETRRLLGDAAWHSARAEGLTMPLDEAMKYALEAVPLR